MDQETRQLQDKSAGFPRLSAVIHTHCADTDSRRTEDAGLEQFRNEHDTYGDTLGVTSLREPTR